MARLPQPGGDSGSWGDILNEYLTQVHKTDGSLKDNVVTSSAIAPNAITSTEIANGTIQEAQLTSQVQAKLNQATPSWSTLSGKPAVIAAGADQASARAAIGAVSVADTGRTIVRDPSATALQAALDAAETAGGGVVALDPTVVYSWNFTIQIGSNVTLDLAGAKYGGTWSGGGALITNKGYDQPGYGGAHDFKILNAWNMNTAYTNGIVLSHASNVEIHSPGGTRNGDHYVDAAATRNLKIFSLGMRGLSANAALQIDNTRTGGSTNQSLRLPNGSVVLPLYDDTGCDGVTVIGGEIDLTDNIGQGAVHFHRGNSTNVTIMGVKIKVPAGKVAVLQDAGLSHANCQFIGCIIEGTVNLQGTVTPKFYDCIVNGERRDDTPSPVTPPASTAGIQQVVHGNSGFVPRPADAEVVLWAGGVAPVNAVPPDMWLNTETGLTTLYEDVPPIAGIGDVGLWLDASTIEATDGQMVQTWSDLSGNNYDFDATSSIAAPILQENGINGRPALRFGSDTGRMIAASAIEIGRNVPGLTSFVVVTRSQALPTSGQMRAFEISTTTATASRLTMRLQEYMGYDLSTVSVRRLNTDTLQSQATSLSSRAIPELDVPFIWSANANYAGGLVTVEQIMPGNTAGGSFDLTSSGNTSDSDSVEVAVGNRTGANSARWLGLIAEVIVFRKSLTAPQMESMNLYLKSKYGIST